MTAQSKTLFLQKNILNTTQIASKIVSFAQVASSAVYEAINLESEPIKIDQSTEFQKKFDLIKQIEGIYEPYRAHSSELSDIDILKKFFHGYHAAYFSSANLQLSSKTMNHCSSEIESAATFFPLIIFFHNQNAENFQ